MDTMAELLAPVGGIASSMTYLRKIADRNTISVLVEVVDEFGGG